MARPGRLNGLKGSESVLTSKIHFFIRHVRHVLIVVLNSAIDVLCLSLLFYSCNPSPTQKQSVNLTICKDRFEQIDSSNRKSLYAGNVLCNGCQPYVEMH